MRLLKGVPKTHVYRVIRSGEVRVNKGRAAADTRLAIGDDVRVPPVRVAAPSTAPPPPRRASFRCCFEDDALLAIDKPAGVAVHGGSGVSFGVIEQLRRARPAARMLELVHRLDKETSGVLLLAKKRSALTALQDQFRARETGKTYAALVLGDWPAKLKVIDVAAAQDAGRPRRAPCAAGGGRPRWPALDQPGHGQARTAGPDAAGRGHQDRPHAPDPRAPRSTSGTRSWATRSTATSRSTRPLRARDGLAGRCAFDAHVPACPRGWPSTTRPPASASTCTPPCCRCRKAPAAAGAQALLDTAIAMNGLTPPAPLRPDRLRLGRHAVRFHRADRALHPGRLPRLWARGGARRCATPPMSSAWACTMRLQHAVPGLPPERYPELGQALPPPLHRPPARAGAVPRHPGDAGGSEGAQPLAGGGHRQEPPRAGRGAGASAAWPACSTPPAPPTRPPASRTRACCWS